MAHVGMHRGDSAPHRLNEGFAKTLGRRSGTQVHMTHTEGDSDGWGKGPFPVSPRNVGCSILEKSVQHNRRPPQPMLISLPRWH